MVDTLTFEILIRSLRLCCFFAVDGCVFEGFDEFEFDDGQDRSGERTDPVDPMRGCERLSDDGGPERTGRVQGAACPEDACLCSLVNDFWEVGLDEDE